MTIDYLIYNLNMCENYEKDMFLFNINNCTCQTPLSTRVFSLCVCKDLIQLKMLVLQSGDLIQLRCLCKDELGTFIVLRCGSNSRETCICSV
jgi:hypothetical protein